MYCWNNKRGWLFGYSTSMSYLPLIYRSITHMHKSYKINGKRKPHIFVYVYTTNIILNTTSIGTVFIIFAVFVFGAFVWNKVNLVLIDFGNHNNHFTIFNCVIYDLFLFQTNHHHYRKNIWGRFGEEGPFFDCEHICDAPQQAYKNTW